jgi:hypothetical protein
MSWNVAIARKAARVIEERACVNSSTASAGKSTRTTLLLASGGHIDQNEPSPFLSRMDKTPLARRSACFDRVT